MTNLYVFDANGYLANSEIFQPGATSVAPPSGSDLPAGKVPRWTGRAWELVDDPSLAVAGVDYSALPKTLSYDAGTGNLSAVTAGPDGYGATYVQTLSYTNGKLTGISSWVKQ